jgi:hypothetical protein
MGFDVSFAEARRGWGMRFDLTVDELGSSFKGSNPVCHPHPAVIPDGVPRRSGTGYRI